MPRSIRFASPDDAETILELIRALAVYEREPDAVETNAATLRQQLSRERPPFECLLAEVDGRAVGFALFFANYSTWLGRSGIHLEDLVRRGELHAAGRALRPGRTAIPGAGAELFALQPQHHDHIHIFQTFTHVEMGCDTERFHACRQQGARRDNAHIRRPEYFQRMNL